MKCDDIKSNGQNRVYQRSQYVYDAVAEYRVGKRLGRQEPDAVRKLKDQLLRSKIQHLENKDAERSEKELAKLKES